MNTGSVLIVGCGDLGIRISTILLEGGWKVYGLRRSIERLPKGIIGVQVDLLSPMHAIAMSIGNIDYIVYSVSPNDATESAYQNAYLHALRNLLEWVSASGILVKRFFFTSSTSVYTENNGNWVDECSLTGSTTCSSRVIVESERILLNSGIPSTIVRLAGLYGPGRTYLLDRILRGYTLADGKDAFTNRIHIKDAARLLCLLIFKDLNNHPLKKIYIGSDNCPVLLSDLVDWLRYLLEVKVKSKNFLTRRSSKKCSNKLIRSTGWVPIYSSYREGYQEILSQR